MPALNLDELIATLTAERISLMVTVPAIYSLMLRHKEFADTDVSGVRWVGYGGAPIAPVVGAVGEGGVSAGHGVQRLRHDRDRVADDRAARPGRGRARRLGGVCRPLGGSRRDPRRRRPRCRRVGGARSQCDCRLLEPAAGDRGHHRRTAGCTPATWFASTTRAGCTSSTGSRTSSTAAARTSPASRSRRCCWRRPMSRMPACWRCPTRSWGKRSAPCCSAAQAQIDVPAVLEHCRGQLADFKVPQYVTVVDRSAAAQCRWQAAQGQAPRPGAVGRPAPMSATLLIANRGEIALRIIRTATELGIQTVAVYAEDDADSPHVHAADEAIGLPGAGADGLPGPVGDAGGGQEVRRRADSSGLRLPLRERRIRPRCAAAGYTFVGPDADVLELVGNKSSARAAAIAAGVPVLPATEGPSSVEDVRAFFADHDGAIMIKALAGGGGRGMRKVDSADQIDNAYRQCAAEAQLGFGDPAVFAEAVLDDARHIEVQIVAAPAGHQTHALALGDRDCSIQRRYQKLVEIAPAARAFGRAAPRAAPGRGPAVRQGRACAGWPPSNSWSPVTNSSSSRSTRASRSSTRSPRKPPGWTWWPSSWPSPAARPTTSWGCRPESPRTVPKSSASPPPGAASRFRPGSTWRPSPPTGPWCRRRAP